MSPVDGSASTARSSRAAKASPCTIVIFGGTGDLTRRKLMPALYNLSLEGFLPDSFAVVGTTRKPFGNEDFRELMQEGVRKHSRQPYDDEKYERLGESVCYVQADGDYTELARRLDAIDVERGTAGNRLFYLAVPPSAFPSIVRNLGAAGLNRPGRDGAWARVIVEKPTGRDLPSARELNQVVNGVFDESNVFRIDHYLGKETVQNLLVFRFANAIWEPLWNQKYVDHVQITVAESLGVGTRGAYYEESGVTRDMVQNHLFQLLCLTAMEPPVSLKADAIRDEKVKVLQALRPVDPHRIHETTVRGQYGSGVVAGEAVAGYKDEPGVNSHSRTETYVALEMYVDNWRWAGVPFLLRSGKRLNKRVTEIALKFRAVPHRLFTQELTTNTLALRIQPDEGITLRFDAKQPGTKPLIQSVDMDFHYGTSFEEDSPEAYERLILDAMLGESTLFIRRDEVEAAWSYIDQLQEAWREGSSGPLPEYTAGTWGPAEAHVMVARGGRTWRRL